MTHESGCPVTNLSGIITFLNRGWVGGLLQLTAGILIGLHGAKFYKLFSMTISLLLVTFFPLMWAQKIHMLFTTVGIVFTSILDIALIAVVYYYLNKYVEANKYVLCVVGASGFAYMIETTLINIANYSRPGNFLLMTGFCIICAVISAPVHHRQTLFLMTAFIGAFCTMRGFTIFLDVFYEGEFLQPNHPQFGGTL